MADRYTKVEQLKEQFKAEDHEMKNEDELVRRLKSETGFKEEDDFIVNDGFEPEAFADENEAYVARNVNLPSNLDSKLWRLKVTPGLERQLVMRLTNKLISCLNEGHPLMVL